MKTIVSSAVVANQLSALRGCTNAPMAQVKVMTEGLFYDD
jgi:hypothetical protein